MIKTSLKISLIPICSFTASYSYAELSYEQEVLQNCTKVKQFAKMGKTFYDQKQYDKALEKFKAQAVWSQFCAYQNDSSNASPSERDIAIAYNNLGITYAKLNQPLWARAWYQLNIKNKSELKSTSFNLKQLPKPQPSSDISGQ